MFSVTENSCFPLTVAFLHREKVLLSPTGGRFVFRDGKQLFSVASPGAAPLEQRRRPRAEARDRPRAHIRSCLLRSCLLRSSLPRASCAWCACCAWSWTSTVRHCFGYCTTTRIAKCPDFEEPKEPSGCLWFSAVCHLRPISIFPKCPDFPGFLTSPRRIPQVTGFTPLFPYILGQVNPVTSRGIRIFLREPPPHPPSNVGKLSCCAKSFRLRNFFDFFF